MDNKTEYYTEGLVAMSPTMIKQVIQEALGLGLQSELEVPKHITVNYGGPLLENAALVEKHWPIFATVNTNTDPQKQTDASAIPNNPLLTPKPLEHPAQTNTTLGDPSPLLASAHTRQPMLAGGADLIHPASALTNQFTSAPVLPPPIIHSPFSNLGSTAQISSGPNGPGAFDTNWQTAVCHHLDRIASNPEVATKHGTLEGIKRLEEIWVYAARGFDTLPVALRPGIIGKHLAIQLKTLNTQLWKLYEHLQLPVAFTNKLCLGAASLSWGGSDSDPTGSYENMISPLGLPLILTNTKLRRSGL